ncbi:MAG: NAD-dependent epimerase/dehydratase family protein [Anaerolineales bacterium]
MPTTSALVTGATGFVGSRLTQHLTQQGVRVRALVRPSSDLSVLEGTGVDLVEGDLFDLGSLLAACEGMDLAYHCAGQVAEWRRPSSMITSHVAGTENMLQAAKMAGVGRLIYTSSVAALGVPRPDDPNPNGGMQASHLWNSQSAIWPYGFAKHRSETKVWQAVAAGLNAVIVAPSAVFGPGDVKRVDKGILPIMMSGRIPPVAPMGGLNAVHIDDVVVGLEAAAARGVRGKKYLIVGENLSHLEFLRITAEVVGARPPRWLLPPEPLRSLGKLAALLSPHLPLPPRSTILNLMGYHFYFDGEASRAALKMPAPQNYRQAAQDAYHWLINETKH